MLTFGKLLRWSDGRKRTLAASALLVLGFAINRGWLAQDVADLVLALLAVWTGLAVGHAEVKARR